MDGLLCAGLAAIKTCAAAAIDDHFPFPKVAAYFSTEPDPGPPAD
jgi:hypothetical protein